MPGPKNGERPYLAVPEPLFWGLFLGLFYSHFILDSSISTLKLKINNLQATNYQLGMVHSLTHTLHHPYYTSKTITIETSARIVIRMKIERECK